MAGLRIFVVLAFFALTGPTRGQQNAVVVFPKDAVIRLPSGEYRLILCAQKCMGLAHQGSLTVLRSDLDGRTVCAVGSRGIIYVAAALTLQAQAKVLFHEVVHTAADCDARDVPLGERTAQAVSALLDSPVRDFVVRGM